MSYKGSKKGVYKVEKALVETSQAIGNVNEILENMSEFQRRLFLSLVKGRDHLKALLEAGGMQYINGIAKIVYLKEMKRNGDGPAPFAVKNLTVDNVDDLDPASYQRLLSIATSTVKAKIRDFNPTNYNKDLRQLFSMVAPAAIGTVTDIMENGKSEKNRLTAAQDLLDRAGFSARDSEKEQPKPPVMIQINLGGVPKSENNPLEVWKQKDNEN
jgi:hypothetical protein